MAWQKDITFFPHFLNKKPCAFFYCKEKVENGLGIRENWYCALAAASTDLSFSRKKRANPCIPISLSRISGEFVEYNFPSHE